MVARIRLHSLSCAWVNTGQLLAIIRQSIVVADSHMLGVSSSPERPGHHVGEAIGHALSEREGLVRDGVDWYVLAVSIPGPPPYGDQDIGRGEEEDKGDDGRDDERLSRSSWLVELFGVRRCCAERGSRIHTLRTAVLPMVGNNDDVGGGLDWCWSRCWTLKKRPGPASRLNKQTPVRWDGSQGAFRCERDTGNGNAQAPGSPKLGNVLAGVGAKRAPLPFPASPVAVEEDGEGLITSFDDARHRINLVTNTASPSH